MSVRSVKTAVTCEKPLRDSERVLSRPGAPDSAVSIGNVICFSISAGDSAGAKVLICTCLLVMSGTASIGSLVSAKAPRHAAMAASTTTTQRRRMEKSMTHAIMSVLTFRSLGLFQFGLQREGVGDGIGLAGRKAADDLDIVIVLAAGLHQPCCKTVLVAHEQRRRALDRLQRVARHDHFCRRVAERDFRGD